MLTEKPMTDAAQRSEVDQNYDFFQRNLSTVLPKHEGQYALLKAGRFEGFFDKPGDAYREGIVRFPDKLFSIQQITREPLDLGFFSHAGA